MNYTIVATIVLCVFGIQVNAGPIITMPSQSNLIVSEYQKSYDIALTPIIQIVIANCIETTIKPIPTTLNEFKDSLIHFQNRNDYYDIVKRTSDLLKKENPSLTDLESLICLASKEQCSFFYDVALLYCKRFFEAIFSSENSDEVIKIVQTNAQLEKALQNYLIWKYHTLCVDQPLETKILIPLYITFNDDETVWAMYKNASNNYYFKPYTLSTLGQENNNTSSIQPMNDDKIDYKSKRLAVCSISSGSVIVYDKPDHIIFELIPTKTQMPQSTLAYDPVFDSTLSPNGKYLITSHYKETPYSLLYSPDSPYLLSYFIHDLDTSSSIKLSINNSELCNFSFSDNSDHLAWNTKTTCSIQKVKTLLQQTVSPETTVNAPTRKQSKELIFYGKPVFLHNAHKLLLCSHNRDNTDYFIFLYNYDTKKPAIHHAHTKSKEYINDVNHLSLDNNFIFSCNNSATAFNVFDAFSLQQLAQFDIPKTTSIDPIINRNILHQVLYKEFDAPTISSSPNETTIGIYSRSKPFVVIQSKKKYTLKELIKLIMPHKEKTQETTMTFQEKIARLLVRLKYSFQKSNIINLPGVQWLYKKWHDLFPNQQ